MHEQFVLLSLDRIEELLDDRIRIFERYALDYPIFWNRLNREKLRHTTLRGLITFQRKLLELLIINHNNHYRSYLLDQIALYRGFIQQQLSLLVPKIRVRPELDAFRHIECCSECLEDILVQEDLYENLTPDSDRAFQYGRAQ